MILKKNEMCSSLTSLMLLVYRGHVWDFGKIDVPFIVRFRLIESSSYFISVADVAFTDCKRGKVDCF